MPLYEYKCSACGGLFEVIQKFSDLPLTTHEKCGGPVERQISTSAFQFKGSGWYVTDYAKGNGRSTQEKADKQDKPDKPKTDTAKADSPKADSGSSTPAKSSDSKS